jgi:hypothetical protein
LTTSIHFHIMEMLTFCLSDLRGDPWCSQDLP